MIRPSGVAGSAAREGAAAHQSHQAALVGDRDDGRAGQAEGLAGGHLHPHGLGLLHVVEAASGGAAHHHRPGGGAQAQLAAGAGELPLPPGAAGGAEDQQRPGGQGPDGGSGVGGPQHPALRRWGRGRAARSRACSAAGSAPASGEAATREAGHLQGGGQAPGHPGGEQGVGPAGDGGDHALDPGRRRSRRARPC